MKVRIVFKPDKTISVIHPFIKSWREKDITNKKGEIIHKKETKEEWLKRVFDKAMVGDLAGLPYEDKDVSELPQSRKYRNAWESEKGKPITINATKKTEIDNAEKNK